MAIWVTSNPWDFKQLKRAEEFGVSIWRGLESEEAAFKGDGFEEERVDLD